MKISNIQISIITLTKNNNSKFIKTLKSVYSQIIECNIEWLIIDGSGVTQYKNKKKLINKKNLKSDKIFIKHINSNKKNLKGIFPCMNYGKTIAKGKFIIFLNSGDTFFDKNSLNIYSSKCLNIDENNSLIFGQAKIIATKNISWFFPSKRLKNIDKWLNFFEPNHQTMLISKNLANKMDFPIEYGIIADGYWKRKILKHAKKVIYLKTPLIKFFLDGVSSSRPSNKVIQEIINNRNICFIRKIIFIIKFILPKKIYDKYFLLQKYKSFLFDYFL